jgi:hypothetical protein
VRRRRGPDQFLVNRPSDTTARRRAAAMLWGVAFILGAVAFWWLRIRYWAANVEVPFSDMADFEKIAVNVWRRCDFRHGPFWQSYRPPGVPLMRAAVMAAFGRDEELHAWRWALGSFTFAGLVWMAYEIGKATEQSWLGIVVMWTVALAKSSIFWSFKVASEAPAEALLYYCIASSLLAVRTRRKSAYFVTGGFFGAALLTRPNFLSIALLCPAVLLGLEWWRPAGSPRSGRPVLARFAALALGLGLVWSPWLIRTHRLYGHAIPLTTHGPFAFFWELGTVRVDLGDGSVVTTSEDELITEAPKRFENDYLAARYVQWLGTRWLADNWRFYVRLVLRRVVHGATDSSEALSRVSRTELFPGRMNAVLLDKSPAVLVAGLAGLVILCIRFPPLTLVLVGCLGPWVFAVLICGYARYVDPMVPLMLAGNAGWIVALRMAMGAGNRRRAADVS